MGTALEREWKRLLEKEEKMFRSAAFRVITARCRAERCLSQFVARTLTVTASRQKL